MSGRSHASHLPQLCATFRISVLATCCLIVAASAIAEPRRLGRAARPARPPTSRIVDGTARRACRRAEGVDQPRGARFHAASDAAVDGAQPGAGGAADDHLLRPHRRRAESAAAGDRHAKPSAHAGHHHAVAVSDAVDYDARLEAGLRRGGRALHATQDRRGAGVEGRRGADPPLHEHADRAHARTPRTFGCL